MIRYLVSRRGGKHHVRAAALIAVLSLAACTGTQQPVESPVFSLGSVPATLAPAETQSVPDPLDHHFSVFQGNQVGSGFLIGSGYLVTNAHVLPNRSPGAAVAIRAGDGRRLAGRVASSSERMDLALVALEGTEGPVPILSGTRPGANARVRAAGVNASGISTISHVSPRATSSPAAAWTDRIDPASLNRSVAAGTVSTVTRRLYFGDGFIASMPSARFGFSGGPVFDATGRLVGMLAAIRHEPDGSISAFILHADTVAKEAARLLVALPRSGAVP